MSESVAQITTADEAQITLQHFGDGDAPRLIFSHGNGFSVDAFRSLTSCLAQWASVFAFDLRNHGRNATHSLRHHTQEHLREDLLTVIDSVTEADPKTPTFGLFHSISGVHALHAQITNPSTFAGLVLLEPPISPPPSHTLYRGQMDAQAALVQSAMRRRDCFESPQELATRIGDRPAFQYVSAFELEAYCAGVLRRVAGGYTLRCPREFEAAGYEQNLDDGLYDALKEISIPVLVVASKQAGFRRSLSQALVDHAGFDLLLLENVTHLMPLEIPRLISSLAQSYLLSR